MPGTDQLKSKLAQAIGWERRKRRERICAAAACVALALALLLAPLNTLLPAVWWRWLVPLVLFAVLAPCILYRRRWQRRDDARAAVLLDRTLALDERAVTAWELAQRPVSSAAAELVYKEAEEKLRTIDPRALFPRRWGWPAYVAAPLFVLWFTFLWFDFDRQGASAPSFAPAPTLAQKAREFAHELQERAREQGLNESLKMGQELEKVARAGVENESADEAFKKDLAGVREKFAEAANSAAGDAFSAAESRQSLQDLRAELGAARDLAQLPDLPQGAEGFGREWMDRLSSFPQLKRRLDQASRGGQSPGGSQIRSFLDKLEREVTGELDRRALLDAQQYLQQMMKQEQGQQGHQLARGSGTEAEDSAADGAKEKGRGSRPGKEPGETGGEDRTLPQFRADAASPVKGALGQGESNSLMFKGNPKPGKSTVPREEEVASYRRQAEQELNSERVPEALRETIKNYFLSLGDGSR